VYSRKAILAFYRLAHRTVRCTTGHCPVRISFLIWRSRPLQSWSRWRTGHYPVHTGQSGAPPDTVRCGSLSLFGEADRCSLGAVGAPDTVRCPFRPLALATRRARILRPTICPTDCWLTGQYGAPPDSPVIFSRMPPSKSREQLVRQSQPGAPDTVRCTTGQSGAPRLSRLLAASSQAFPVEFPLILTLRQTC
jgi:hypothetical protein